MEIERNQTCWRCVGLPALANLEADQAPIQVGVFLIVADTHRSIVEKWGIDVEQILNIQRHLCVTQPSECIPGSLIAQLHINGGPGRHSPAGYADGVSITVFKIDESRHSEAAALPRG